MKKSFLTALCLGVFTSSLFADYEVFEGKSEPFGANQIVSKEVIFFGELDEYSKSLRDIQKSILKHGAMGAIDGLSDQSATLAKGFLKEGFKGGATGLGIGMFYGMLNPYIMSFYADQQYIQIYSIKLKNKKTVYMYKFLVCDKHPALNEDKIKDILGDK